MCAYSDVFAIEKDVRHVDLINVEPVFQLALEFFVFVQIALLVADAVILQDLFHSLAFVVGNADNLQTSCVDNDFFVLLLFVVSLKN